MSLGAWPFSAVWRGHLRRGQGQLWRGISVQDDGELCVGATTTGIGGSDGQGTRQDAGGLPGG